MYVSWSVIKAFCISRGLSIQWIDIIDSYELKASDGIFALSCNLPKSDTVDVADFESGLKLAGNKPQPTQIQPFASKSLLNGKNLFKRFTGTSFSLTTGSNTLTWSQSAYPLVKFLGIEVINAEIGDTCDLYVLDTPTGTFSGIANHPLNQFAFNANLGPSFYKHVSEYDSDLYQHLQIRIVYRSVSDKTLYVNFNMNEVK